MIVHIDDYFTDIGKSYIHKTIDMFENYKCDKPEKLEIRILDENYNVYVHPIKDGIDVQLATQAKTSQANYMFGVMIFHENNVQKAHVYHNGHGPFKCYNFEYELN
jgi:membrane-bound inhibitor of C-type lysozyme